MINIKPKLRFLEFSGEWKVKKFSDIYSFYGRNHLSRALLNYEDINIKNIHYGDIHTKFRPNFDIRNEDVPFINLDVDLTKIKAEQFCKQKDLIISDTSENYNDIGKTIELMNLDNQKLLAGLHTYIARDEKNQMALGYSGYLMQTADIRLQIKKLATGTSVLSISKGNLSRLKITIPKFLEQEKITSFLFSVDAKIEKLQKKKKPLGEYKKGIIEKIFSQELRFKGNNGNSYPEWEEKKLGKITSSYDGTHHTPKYIEEGIPFYSVEHVTSNQFEKTKFISKEFFEKENKRVKLEKNDILMTRIGSIGEVKLIDWDVNASFYGSLAVIKSSPSFNSKYLNFLIQSNFFQKELWKRTIHVAFPKKINLGEIGMCSVKLPCFEEQEKIANFLSTIDRKLEVIDIEIDKMNEFKKGLLQQMFV